MNKKLNIKVIAQDHWVCVWNILDSQLLLVQILSNRQQVSFINKLITKTKTYSWLDCFSSCLTTLYFYIFWSLYMTYKLILQDFKQEQIKFTKKYMKKSQALFETKCLFIGEITIIL